MAIRPQRPVQVNSRSGLGRGMERSGGAASLTTGGPAVALDVNEAQVLDRAVTRNLAGDTLGRRGHVRVLVGLVELVVHAADGGIVDVAVGGSDGS